MYYTYRSITHVEDVLNCSSQREHHPHPFKYHQQNILIYHINSTFFTNINIQVKFADLEKDNPSIKEPRINISIYSTNNNSTLYSFVIKIKITG